MVWLVLALAPAGASAGQEIYPTFFTKFRFEASSGESEKFEGKIDSSKGSCVKDRKIVLYRKKNGDKNKVGSDKTDGKGKFSIGVGNGPPKNGKYFAQAKDANSGNGGTCLEENSAKVTIS